MILVSALASGARVLFPGAKSKVLDRWELDVKFVEVVEYETA